MTPNERTLIAELFNRIRSTEIRQRDAEAEQLIEAEMARTPGAAYALAQTVLVQDHALREALEQVKKLDAVRSTGPQDEPEEAPHPGSMLGRIGLGGGRPGAVPRTGQPEEDQAFPARASAESGGFLRGALQTAAGVAGGALLFEGIRSLLGGNNEPSGERKSASGSFLDNLLGTEERDKRDDQKDDEKHVDLIDDESEEDPDAVDDWSDGGFDGDDSSI
jgi:hypothetical protein